MTPDCKDGCSMDAGKTSPGLCGCSTLNLDTVTDGTTDGRGQCANDMDKIEPNICGCGMSDAKSDGDGIASCFDNLCMT